MTRGRPKTHGLSYTPEYMIWHMMVQRCHNEFNEAYKDYGARGIKVCDEWRKSVEQFIKDVGMRPSNKHTIERKDVNGDYCPENVVWDTWDKQARNRRKRSDNSSGKTGVSKVVINNCTYWVAFAKDWETGKQVSKYCSVKKLGEDEAFRQACLFRDAFIEVLNTNGAGYTESHGQ